jgi:DNA ligase-1
MLLADVARTSNQVSGTRSRLSKVSLISDLLQQCARQVAGGLAPADEVGLATRYLSGSLRQRRTGMELTSLSELWKPRHRRDAALAERRAAQVRDRTHQRLHP